MQNFEPTVSLLSADDYRTVWKASFEENSLLIHGKGKKEDLDELRLRLFRKIMSSIICKSQ